MAPNRPDEILADWSAVARTATPPPSPATSVGTRAGAAGINVAGAGLLALAFVIGLAWLAGRDQLPSAGDTSPSPSTIAPSPEASTAVVPEPSLTSAPSLNPCVHLATPITWEGGAGQRIAHITLMNREDNDCLLGEFARVEFVDAGNEALIEGPAAEGFVTVPANDSVSTLVEIGNYCGPEPSQPVGIIFRRANGGFLLVGSSESDAAMSVPPCNGPNAPPTIDMAPWASS